MEIERVPKHVGLILDGNRRFAKRLMMKPWKGHEWGSQKTEKIFEWALEYGVKELTLYTLSVQNFYSRPKDEFNFLIKLFKKEGNELKNDERLFKHKIKINFIGRIHMFDEELQGMMKEIMDKTRNHDNLIVNFAMAYGGQEEVIDAVRRIAEQVKENKLDVDKINEEVFENNLYMKSSPELIIRTGGERRTSNFLNYQASYSEWIFLGKLWPEFDKQDFVECLQEYSERSRRFGR
tara:strand:+ start:605 stop:1312 length:708 start_codon:yes stop_codon:yes gene_type:complete